MAIRIEKPWQRLTPEAMQALPGQLGVYQLADAQGQVVAIGYAGGHALFGLRSAIEHARAEHPGAVQFRYEVTQQYMSRYEELLMLHHADHGALPVGNRDAVSTIGRLSPL